MTPIRVVEQRRTLQHDHLTAALAQHRAQRRQLGQGRHVVDGDRPRRGTPAIEVWDQPLTLGQALERSGDESCDPLALRLLKERVPLQAAAEKPDQLVLGGGAEEPPDGPHEHLRLAREPDLGCGQRRSPHALQCSRIAACTAGSRDRSRRKASR